MKVACEGCGAKYAIPEDKIQGVGRTFKVTCRVCNAIIVIKGIGDGSEAKWYVAIGRDRQGPVSAADIAAKLQEGTLTPESLAWCQGMEGWLAIAEISALQGALHATAEGDPEVAVDISDDTTMVAQSDIEAAHAAMATMSAEADAAPKAPVASTGSSFEGLFDQAAPLETSGPAHERADTSVLFSLDDLAKSTNNPLPGVNFGPSSDGEQSGLLDVNATKPRSANRRRPLTQSPFDDAPAPVSRPVESATNTIAVPVIKRRSNTLPIAIGALLVLGGGAFAIMQMMQSEPEAPQPKVVTPATTASAATTATSASVKAGTPEVPKAAQAPPKSAPDAPVKAATKPVSADAQKDEKAAKPEEAAPTKTAKTDEVEKELSPAERRRQRRLERRERRRAKGESAASSGKSAEPKRDTAKAEPPKPASKAAPAPPPPAEAKSTAPKKDVNALLATLNKNKGAESSGGASPSAGNLPQRLSSSKLRSTLRRKKGAFKNCYKKMAERPAGGITVNTSLVVAGSGSVKSVRITSGGGASAGVLRCISSALKSAKFPAFAASQMSVNYPITLR